MAAQTSGEQEVLPTPSLRFCSPMPTIPSSVRSLPRKASPWELHEVGLSNQDVSMHDSKVGHTHEAMDIDRRLSLSKIWKEFLAAESIAL